MNAANFTLLADSFSRATNLLDYNGTYSVLFWLYINTLPSANRNLYELTLSGSDTDVLRLVSSNAIQLRIVVGGAATNTNGTVLSGNTWYHLAMVRSSVTDLQCYLNGVSDITNTRDVTGRSASSTEDVVSSATDCRIADIKLYSINLSADDIVKEMGYQWAQTNRASLHEVYPIFPGARRTLGIVNGYNWTENGTVTDVDGPPNVVEIPGPQAYRQPSMLLRR